MAGCHNGLTMRRLIGAAALMLITALALPAAAEPGTPKKVSSDPQPRATVHHVHEVSVTFNEPLDPTVSNLRVFACDERVDSGEPRFSETYETISVDLDESPPGKYSVVYHATGVDDTPEERANPTEGSFGFALHYARCEDDDKKHDHDKKNDKGDHGHGKDRDRHHGNGKDRRHHDPDDGDHTGRHTTQSSDHDAHMGSPADGHSEHSTTKEHDGKHSRGERHPDHDRAHSNRKHEEKGGRHRGHDRDSRAAGPTPSGRSRPNNVLNLALVLLIPAALGALGGRALRARALSTAS